MHSTPVLRKKASLSEDYASKIKKHKGKDLLSANIPAKLRSGPGGVSMVNYITNLKNISYQSVTSSTKIEKFTN